MKIEDFIKQSCKALKARGYSRHQIAQKTGIQWSTLDSLLADVDAGNYSSLDYPDNVLQVMVALLKAQPDLLAFRCRQMLRVYPELQLDPDDFIPLFARAQTLVGIAPGNQGPEILFTNDEIESLLNIYDEHGAVVSLEDVCEIWGVVLGYSVTTSVAVQVLRAEGVEIDEQL